MNKLIFYFLSFCAGCFPVYAEVPYAEDPEAAEEIPYFNSPGEAYFDSIGAEYPLANIYDDVENEAYESIIANVEKVLAVVPDDSMAVFYRGIALFLQDKYREALPDIIFAWETDTEDEMFSSPYEILQRIGTNEPDLFIRTLEQKETELGDDRDKKSKLYDIYMLLGNVSVRTGHSRMAAERYYPKAAAVTSDEQCVLNAYISASTGWLRSGHPDKALEVLENPVLDNVPPINKYHNKVQALRNLGRIDEALRFHDELLKTHPDEKELLIGKGTLLSAVKRYDEAIECFDKAIAVLESPSYFYSSYDSDLLAEAYLRRGIAYEFKGDASRAEEDLTTVLNQDSSGFIISALAHLKRKEELEKLMDLYGPNLGATTYALIYTQLGDFDNAFRYLKDAFRLQEVCPVAIKYDPNLVPLVNDPRFIEAEKYFDPSK